jgi:hypothetical protein
VLVALGIWGVFRFLSFSKAPKAAESVLETKGGTRASPGASLVLAPVVSEWRSVGIVSYGSRNVFVVEQEGRYRFIFDSPEFRIDGLDVKVGVDGKAATGYSGSVPRAGGVNSFGK